MKTLAIDIGTGTQDILIYDDEKELENSIKLVLPSPHIYIAQLIEDSDNDIYFNGEIMGGGKLKNKILEHIEKGYDVVMEPHCAKTIRDNLEEVKSFGIKIANPDDDYKGYTKITLGDIDIKKLANVIIQYDLDFDFDNIAIAVQDHGYSEEMGDRDFRFEKIREKLEKPMKAEEFGIIEDVSGYYSRMKSVENSLKEEGLDLKPVIMDTKFASIAGMQYDEVVEKLDSYVVIDIGNGHTTAASIENGKIQGVFEHHTSNLDGKSLNYYITKLANGTLTNKEVYDDHGHGAHVLNPLSKLEKVIVSGPKRQLIEDSGLDWHHACPGGDVMMTGTIGLIKTSEYLLNV